MPYASPYPAPGGTFTFINPTVDGKPREYTPAEAFDIINEILQASTKHTLIRRDVTLTMLPADAEFPEYYFPRVDAKDLGTRGKTEIVRTTVTVTNQDVDLVAGQVKRLLGEFGYVIPLPETTSLSWWHGAKLAPGKRSFCRTRRINGPHAYAQVRYARQRGRDDPPGVARPAAIIHDRQQHRWDALSPRTVSPAVRRRAFRLAAAAKGSGAGWRRAAVGRIAANASPNPTL